MRTLVLGLPLPHYTFDNYSFLSAPSLSDYPRIIVEMASLSQIIEEVVAGSQEHTTFAGQPVVNGATSIHTFGLADLLAMRRREAERFLARGGTQVVLAQPDLPHYRIQGLPVWRRYAWLPSPEGFHYEEHLLPGFGKMSSPGDEVDHPFAPYFETYGSQLTYRVYVNEDAPGFSTYGRVFARSPGGLAVGVEMKVGPGQVILLPPLSSVEPGERTGVAAALFDCLERAQPAPPEWMRKEVL